MSRLGGELRWALDRTAGILDVGDVRAACRAALSFGRRNGVSPLHYPDARGANLHLVPPWVDIQAGAAVDVGANEGAWTGRVLRVFPGIELIAAEPNPEPRAVLAARFGELPNVTIDPRAVTDATGTSTYHRTRSSLFGSMLPPADTLHDLCETMDGSPTQTLEQIEVGTVTLDELVGERPVSVLKIDVQGGDLALLRGGRAVLDRVGAVLIEVLFQPLYEGDATFPRLHEAMVALNFTLMDLTRPVRLGHGPALFADACYARPPARHAGPRR